MSGVLRKAINFPAWVPQDAREELTSLCDTVHSDRECRYMLQRLATREPMKEAWAQLKQFGKCSPSELVLLTTVTWLSARRFPSLEKSASKPIPPESELASQVRAVADKIRVLHPDFRAAYKITEVTQQELDRVAAYFEQQADRLLFLASFAAPSRKKGARNADQIAFINRFCSLPSPLTSPRRPYRLVAILTNVVFGLPENKDWDAEKVRRCFQSRARRK